MRLVSIECLHLSRPLAISQSINWDWRYVIHSVMFPSHHQMHRGVTPSSCGVSTGSPPRRREPKLRPLPVAFPVSRGPQWERKFEQGTCWRRPHCPGSPPPYLRPSGGKTPGLGQNQVAKGGQVAWATESCASLVNSIQMARIYFANKKYFVCAKTGYSY